MGALPKPYWTDGKRTIYHGDCRAILPLLPKADLCLTDPPYGISRSGQKQTMCAITAHNRKEYVDYGWDDSVPDMTLFDLVFSSASDHIIWGANYMTRYLPASMGWLVWDKGQNISMSDCELAFTSRY